MHPFFRKIRWRLAQNNQFFKYGRYAIGEIVLVVVGILIALQINNWNEEKKEKYELYTNLLKLKKEMEFDLASIEDMSLFLKSADSSALRVQNYLHSNAPVFDTVKIKVDLINAGTFALFNASNTAYSNMVSSGQIDQIENDLLVTSLADLINPRSWNNIVLNELVKDSFDSYLDRLHYFSYPGMVRNYWLKYFAQLLRERYNTNADLGVPLEMDNSKIEFYVDWENMRRDKEFASQLNQLLSYRILQNYIYKQTKKKMQDVLIEIDKEINKNQPM